MELKGTIKQMEWDTINIKLSKDVCYIQFNRTQEKNTINNRMISEIEEAFKLYEKKCRVFVFEGDEEYFCFGADLNAITENNQLNKLEEQNPERLYNLWNHMIFSNCIMVAYVKGTVNAGGIGFICACDIVIASESATFSLSELLFGLMPAMVLPFLIRRVGYAHAKYMALTTKLISAETACKWGLVDVCCDGANSVLLQHLARLVKIPQEAIANLKSYMEKISGIDEPIRQEAITANLRVFSDPINLNRIYKFTQMGIYPWEE